MPPPPSTPTPHRFLAPKRSAASQRTGTPKPLATGTQQFHATPRFSLHSTPREIAAAGPQSRTPSTPAAPGTGTRTAFQRQRHHHHDSINDVIDSSPPVPTLPSHGGLSDSIEVDCDSDAELPPVSPSRALEADESDDDDDDGTDGPPTPKRRRLSLSSVVGGRGTSTSPMSQDEGSHDDEARENSAAAVDADEPQEEVGEPHLPPAAQQQPTFQKAPRFKPVDLPAEAHQHEPLPDAFSPHRRGGAKYVPGGLASELRDWLVHIEASTGAKRDGDWKARVVVDEARASPGMVLVRGRHAAQNNDDDGGGGGVGRRPPREGDESVRLVLAGEGRLVGLARRNEVVVGSLLGIAKPVWEVNIPPEGRWAVSCDWVVLG